MTKSETAAMTKPDAKEARADIIQRVMDTPPGQLSLAAWLRILHKIEVENEKERANAR